MKFKFIVTWLEDLQGFGSRANDSSLDFKRPMESSKATDADAVIFELASSLPVMGEYEGLALAASHLLILKQISETGVPCCVNLTRRRRCLRGGSAALLNSALNDGS
ncbi:hypothetical protein DPX16_12850 [Anabarilius grahami]|uniref:Uncharacterized protein n=1 Tax=Anabarilius grahami TaxID=495550 RepID=A0A3N0XDB6_ANAGA|nr:hypothetical protein DPX16_12850 [Anabarilius grahami]